MTNEIRGEASALKIVVSKWYQSINCFDIWVSESKSGDFSGSNDNHDLSHEMTLKRIRCSTAQLVTSAARFDGINNIVCNSNVS